MRDVDIIDVPQRSPEWFAARLGRVTCSTAAKMLAKTSKGWGAERDNLKWRLVLERMTGRSQESHFTTAAMQDGVDREPLAIGAYEAETGRVVQTCGFLRQRGLMAGASLDGYLGDFETLVSIKCRQPKAHAEHLLTGKIPGDAMTQMLHEMWITGAARHQYVSFNPDFPEPLQLRIVTLDASAFDVAGYGLALLAFLAEVDEAEVALLRKAVA